MTSRQVFTTLASLSLSSSALIAQEAEKITYEDHIKPLLENKCFSCHNPDKKKGDLDLTSFGAVMAGGGGGAVVDAGNVDGSRLWTTCAKKEEPFMPPEGAPLNAKELEILAKWVTGGLLETKSSVAKKSAKPKVDMAVTVTSGKPEGPIAKPEHVLLEPVVVTPRTTAIVAMAASPWTSLVAMAAPKQILLYDTDTKQLAGIFPYTEGYARSLQFSRNGSLLVMGGGRGGKFGHAVVWDVKTGKRMIEVGKEFDQVMAADISPDHKMVAIGCTSKKVKCYDSATGEELYTISKHTEWLLGTKFSPDGILLATCDRNGNVMVWEASNGGEFYILGQHKGPANDLAWRADSNLLASCSKDGTIAVWEMTEGKKVKDWSAHGGGVQSVSFTPEGMIVSSGDDGLVRLWDINGNKKGEFPSQGDIVAKVVALHDGKSCVSSNWRGEIKMLALQEKMSEIGQLSSNPPLITQRILEAEKRATELVAKLPALQESVKKAEIDAKRREENLAKLKAEMAENERRAKGHPGEIDAAQKALGEANQALQKLNSEAKERAAAHKTYAEKVAKLAQLEKDGSAAAAEAAKNPAGKAKADELATAIQQAKSQLGSAPAPVADFNKPIAETTAKIKVLNETINAKKAELAASNEWLKKAPDRLKAAESDVNTGKANLAAAQQSASQLSAELNVFQKLPTILKAAQFNVGVLTEKENLAKLEGNFNDYTAAKKENEEAKAANAAKIEASRKAIAEASNQLPQHEASLNKLKAELAGVQEAIKPTQTADASAKTKLEESQKRLAACEAEVAALVKTRDEGAAAAKKSADDIAKAIEGLKKKLGEVAAKLKGPEEQVKSRQANVIAQETKLAASKKTSTELAAAVPTQEKAIQAAEEVMVKAKAQVEAAVKALEDTQRATAQAGRSIQPARQEVAKAERILNEAKAKNQGSPELEKSLGDAKLKLTELEKAAAESAMTLAGAQAARDDARQARDQAEKALYAAKQALAKTQNELKNTTNSIKSIEAALARAKSDLDAAQKAAAPLRGQQDSLGKEIAAQEKAKADKLAVPVALETEFAAKAKPLHEQIAMLKAGLPALQKAFADARAKLESEVKIVDGKKAEVAKATEALEATKAKKANAEAAIAAAEKDQPLREKNLAEIQAELAKLEPQLDPLRAKVKQLEAQYFTMLPK